MRICVLGDSHTAALKSGLDLSTQSGAGHLNVTFFASRQAGLAGLRARGGRLVAVNENVAANIAFTSGGLKAVEPDQYDAFIVHALGMRFQYPLFDAVFRSPAFVVNSLADSTKRSLSHRLHTSLRSITDKPIFISPQPFQSESNQPLKQAFQSSQTARYDFDQCSSAFLLALDPQARWLPQPPETVIADAFTRRAYSDGSTRLDVSDAKSGKQHPTDDFVHMNAGYGQQFWKSFAAKHA